MKRALWLVALVVACRARSEWTPSSAVTTSVSAVPPAAAASIAPVASQPEPALPTSEDYEESASREISGTNLERELDKLERELEKP